VGGWGANSRVRHRNKFRYRLSHLAFVNLFLQAGRQKHGYMEIPNIRMVLSVAMIGEREA